jgi:hypothetical protein
MRCPECGANIETLELREQRCSRIEVELDASKEHLVEIGKPELTNANDERKYSCPKCHCFLFDDYKDALTFLNEQIDRYCTSGWIKYMRAAVTRDYSDVNALRLAIEKWELIWDGADISVGAATCALCYMHNNRCNECPIGKYTGQTGCDGTPIDGYYDDDDDNHSELKREMVLFLKRLLKRTLNHGEPIGENK